MKIKVTSIFFTVLLAAFLYGCGAGTPGAAQRQLPTAGNNALAVTVYFPQQPAGGPAALISGSTSYFKVWVYDDLFNVIGYARINAPVGGGSTSVSVDLNPYAGPGSVEVWGYNQSGNGNSFMWDNITIQAANNPPVSVVVVEMRQGIIAPAGNTLLSPDNVTYTINNLFVDTTSVVGVQGSYKLGLEVAPSINPASTGYFVSSNNIDATNVMNSIGWVFNGLVDFNIDVPNAGRTQWNRYYFAIDFRPGGIPTNTPTITGQFQGTFAFDASGTVVASTSANVPGPIGTVTMNIPNAAWTNNIAPAPNSQPLILFYGQSPQQNSGRVYGHPINGR